MSLDAVDNSECQGPRLPRLHRSEAIGAPVRRGPFTGRRPHGAVRDAVFAFLVTSERIPHPLDRIQESVSAQLGPVSASSIRSLLRTYSGTIVEHTERAHYRLTDVGEALIREGVVNGRVSGGVSHVTAIGA